MPQAQGNIVALDVLESDETPMIFQGAWEHACEYIISNQNTDSISKSARVKLFK